MTSQNTSEQSPSQVQGQIGEERYGAGDTYLVRDVLPPEEADDVFERVYEEVQWCTMSHRGGEVPRLVACQGTVDADGTMPIYRHPADATPPLHAFTPTVSFIRDHVSRYLPKGHPPLNNVLIQLYRTGEDYISEHSDKTVDVVKGSCIVNVSLGAQRRMTLRTKKNAMHSQSLHHSDSQNTHAPASPPVERTTQRIPLPHNSALVMGLETNRQWLHGIRPDRHPESLLTKPETAFGRERISLTFRSIGTFLTPAGTSEGEKNLEINASEETVKWLIWGQGARNKTRETARPVSSSQEEREALLHAFGAENHFSDFDWDKAYGEGFDVMHFVDT